MQTINFGIDLGTTNSLIARFMGVQVEVFKNPIGLKETLPSCVAFRKERVFVGDKAREWLLKDPLNVFSSFKRKMGTSETYQIQSRGESISPIDLSALVLKELKNFIHSGEIPQSIVVTIPASFDTVQSNATKQAGLAAGFQEVVLLQEPIAASLAYFNKYTTEKERGKWLVYDLGGGTFDVALIGIEDNEMRVLDHQGDNYLGGMDFDHSLVVDILIPEISRQTGLTDLASQLLTRDARYEKLYHILLLKAEEAKKELSTRLTTEIEVTFDMGDGEEVDLLITLGREQFNALIRDRIDATIEMLETIMVRNNVSTDALAEIILIGGSTYIPYVRTTLAERTGLPINTEADPTTAVAVGAAYFAGNTPIRQLVKPTTQAAEGVNSIRIQTGYSKTTKDLEEYISANVINFQEGLSYRITRNDGGFDTALRPLTARFGEFVGLLPNRVNTFTISLFDSYNNPVAVQVDPVDITHGLFSLYGQPLPEDICLEVDDLHNNATRCELVFSRNSVLPLTKTIYREISRTIRKGSDESLIINLLEGDATQHPSTNKNIGVIEVRAADLPTDLVKGSDVEIKLDMSESRDVSVSIHLGMTDQQFDEVFSPTQRYVSLTKLRDELTELRSQLELDLEKALQTEDYEAAARIQDLTDRARTLQHQAKTLQPAAFTDEKYQLDEAKRKLARQLYTNGPVSNRVLRTKERYYTLMESLQYWADTLQELSPKVRAEIQQLKADEPEAMRGNTYFRVEAHLAKCRRIYNDAVLYTPTILVHFFHSYASQSPDDYTDYQRAQAEIKRGEKALDRQNYDELRGVLLNLLGLTKNSDVIETKIKGTGLG
ncbi:Hsp70 family protein [Spirosoma sp. KCTC 42546]|uniref:Hsp70 family protein n=1 Tax=Spirosoma sp. KCTC 42546 TaxID=2520506 RepID=UPI00115C28F2|nr:Hsp70 family protein [Spirosoma sp. KCTC 42546]QDK79544.1 Hsp70 family protein [Spirosoma sp. KCTC 42546]